MAASRSMLEALLARVQKRAAEPRPSRAGAAPVEGARADDVDTLAPRPKFTTGRGEAPEEDIEEYDEELIEIIDDSEMIPQAAAAARAIEPAAFGAALDRRSTPSGAKAIASSAPVPAAATPAVPAVAAVARAATARPAPAAEPLRPESVSARPVAANEVARVQGLRRELRAIPFLELLDESLELGS
jgi:hypothetical protein